MADAHAVRLLRIVLAIKIVGTIVILCLPMLLLGEDAFARWFGVAFQPDLVRWLLAIAYLALVIVYLDGWRAAARGTVPRTVIAAGLVSNGGALAASAVALYLEQVSIDQLGPLGWAAMALIAFATLGLAASWLHERRLAGT